MVTAYPLYLLSDLFGLRLEPIFLPEAELELTRAQLCIFDPWMRPITKWPIWVLVHFTATETSRGTLSLMCIHHGSEFWALVRPITQRLVRRLSACAPKVCFALFEGDLVRSFLWNDWEVFVLDLGLAGAGKGAESRLAGCDSWELEKNALHI